MKLLMKGYEELTEDESRMQIAIGSLETAGGLTMFGVSVASGAEAVLSQEFNR